MQAAQNLNPQTFSWKKFLVLGIVAMALSLSLFMSILAPLPIALVMLFYGRGKGFGLVATGLILFLGLGMFLAKDYSAVVIFGFVSLIGFIISEIAQKEERPSSLIVKVGMSIFALIIGGVGFWIYSQPLPVLEFLETSIIAPQAKVVLEQMSDISNIDSSAKQEIVSVLSNTKFLTKETFVNLPFMVFLFLMVTLWLNSYLLLKGKRLVMGAKKLIFTEYELLNYRVPDQFLVVLIVSLALALFARDLNWELGSLMGMMGLKCLAILYFFHGFGVVIQLLSFWGVRGFFRLAIIISFIGMGSWIVALLGLFDTWFDFRRRVILGSENK